jgi:hypothetical protein
MIVWHSGETCKVNFRDRDEVLKTAKDLVRRGVVLCALCKGFLTVHGIYRRHIRDEEGGREQGWIVQCHCAICKVYPALIPDFIMPYKHYRADVIEQVIAEVETGHNIESLGGFAADVSTMRRWVGQFRVRGAQAAGCLMSILPTQHERHVNRSQLQYESLLLQLYRLLCEYRMPERKGVIGSVNIILTTHNCGFL